jgi:uncharacterized protein YfaS (alpha-2-macroglobulin family)
VVVKQETPGLLYAADLAGTFRVGPATVQSMYAPELAASSAGDVIRVE